MTPNCRRSAVLSASLLFVLVVVGVAEKPECEDLFHSIQFQNLWQKDLLDLAQNGFAQRFGGKKLKGRMKVAIIGAGPAGLATAYELAKFAVETKSKIKITIVEKQSRVGGRIKTVGKKGHFLPNIWNNKKTTSDAGAMRLPLPPQTEMDCKYNRNSSSICSTRNINCVVGSMSDDELQSLVHGSGDFDFVPDEAFPHFLIRHYLKKFKVPVFRHNMGVAARSINGRVFVKGDNGTYRNSDGRGMEDFILEKVKAIDGEFAEFLVKKHHGSLGEAFEESVVQKVMEWVYDHSAIADTDPSEEKEKLAAWKKFQHDWSSTYREHLIKNGWHESVIDIFEVCYNYPTEDRIRDFIMESIGNWWQSEGMMSLRDGMHSLVEKPDKTVGYTAFYDELVKMSKKNSNLKIKFLWKRDIEKIKIAKNGKVYLLRPSKVTGGMTVVGAFNAVVSTIPAPFIRDMTIIAGGENIAPNTALFETFSLFKMHLQFKRPFWKTPRNNKGGFVIDDKNGFLTSTEVVSQFRYPRSTQEPGNVIMMYVFHENAEAFAHKVSSQGYMKNSTAKWKDGDFDDDSGVRDVVTMALEELQHFHPKVNVRSEFTGNFFVQPWVQLSNPPSGFHQMTKVMKYCDDSPKGLYFAGDGFSFKPQWIEGALYTSYHALFRLINDFSGAGLDDPFKTVDDDLLSV